MGGRPHLGVRLILDVRRKEERTWAIRKPAQIPGVLPAGCRQFTPNYDLAKAQGPNPTQEEVCRATRQWYDLAESELVDVMNLDPSAAVAYRGRAEGASFVQKFPMHSKGAAEEGASEASVKWRTIATWATTLLREANLSDPPPGLTRSAKELRAAFGRRYTWKIGNIEAMDEIISFTEQLTGRRLHNKECLAYVIKFATRQAVFQEAKVKAARSRGWSRYVAGSNNGCARGGYMYAKVPIGSQDSPVFDEESGGEDQEQNEIPDGADLSPDRETVRLDNDKVIRRGMAVKPFRECDDPRDSQKRKPASLQEAVRSKPASGPSSGK